MQERDRDTRIYVLGHPLALAFSISMAITGLLILIFPSIRSSSLTIAPLPVWATVVWGIALLVGGVLATIGILRGRPDHESAGMVLLGSTQLVAAVTSISGLGWPGAVIGVVLRGGLAIGCLVRSFFLARDSA